MKITRGYKTELDLHNKQRTACLQHAGAARFAYNWALAKKIEAYANPRSLKHKLKKLKRLSRAHSRKQKGSKNREKSRKQLAVLHARIANIRKDAIHKFTTHVCKNHAHIGIEDLHVAGMLKNHHVAQAISDASMGEVRRQLTYKAAKFGSRVAVIDRFYPSSKTCSMCGWINEDLDLSKRVFVCVECGYLTDRDYNAAKNILAVSLTDSLNACGAGSSDYLAISSETARVEARTKQHVGMS